MTIRVALIDDHPQVHKLVTLILQTTDDIRLVGQSYRADDALEVCRANQPDLVLMDVVMPGKSGIDCTREILEHYPDIKVLALSSFSEFDYIKAMLDIGAVGYIAKDAIADDLVNIIRAAYQGNVILSAVVARELTTPSSSATAHDYGLTNREQAIIRLLAEGKQDKEISTILDISIPTVRFHIGNTVAKMGVNNRSEALVVAARHNLI